MNAITQPTPDFQQIFDAVPGLLLVLAPDKARFTILAATDAYLLATRQRRGEVIGRALLEVLCDNPVISGISAAQSTCASLERAMDLRATDTVALVGRDIAQPTSEGGGFEERHWRAVNSPVMNASGDVAYLIHRIEDVTDLVRAQQNLSPQRSVAEHLCNRDDQAQAPPSVICAVCNLTQYQQVEQLVALQAAELANLYATAPVGLFMFDTGLRYVRINQSMAEINGLPAEQHIGRTLRELLAVGLADTVEALLRQVIETGQPVLNCEVQGATLSRPDEQRCWLVSYHPVQTANGTITGVQGVVQEITERKKAEEDLRESQWFFRSCLNALSGQIAVLDASGTIIETNAAWQRFADENQPPGGSVCGTGVGANYLAHCKQALLQGGDAPDYAQAINDIIAGQRTRFEMEYPCHSPTEQRWFVMRVNRFQSPGPVRIVIVHDDCTGRKLAEEALRESEERYRNLFNSMDEGFCVVEPIYDAQGQMVDCRFVQTNPAFAKQTGAPDMAGKRLREIDPEGQAPWLAICGKVALTGKAVRFVHEQKDLDSQWFDACAVRLGSPGRWQVGIIFNNITLHKRAVDALRYSEQRFRALFDRGPLGMYSCDTSGVILEFNACAVALWGRTPTPDDVDERFFGVSQVYRPDGALLTAAQNPLVAVLKGEIPRANGVEAVIERPDGSRITVIANIVPLKDAQGEIIGAINCFYDTTERSRLERQTREQAQALIDQHRHKDEFLAMLGHELRNPLAPLASAVQLLRLQKSQAPLEQQALDIIERQSGQLKHLVDDLMEMSRITSGNIVLRPDRINVSEVVQSALETVQPLILEHRHDLTVALPPQPVWVHADASRLEQVLVNLLTNAAKYTNAGGRIWLEVGQEGDAGAGAGQAQAAIRVRDSGIGIAPELLPRIFDLFTQAERSLDRSQGGLGIGLCLVKRLVELHGGSVQAHSVVGQGSEFVVRLPRMPVSIEPPPSPSSSSAPPKPPASQGCRVLAVDDNEDAVQTLAMLLKMSGHEVQIAYDGPSALEMAAAMLPDVMLLDIGLPGLTGYEVAEQIRQDERLKHTVLVALTGYGREADRQFSQHAGFDYHLVKPADFREVEKILATVSAQIAQAGR
jgi:PAS domain S-box-containing protein